MRQDIKALLQSILDENAVDGEPARKVKVVANLPYNITKECLVAILPLEAQVSTMVLMLQVCASFFIFFNPTMVLICFK